MSIPSYQGSGILGLLSELEREPLAMMQRASAAGDVVRLKFPAPWLKAWLVNSPALLEEVLVNQPRHFGKTSRGYMLLRRLLGNGLITSDGEFWLRQRRIAQPAFHKDRIAGFARGMVQLTQSTIANWPRGAAFDLHREMMGLTLRVVCQTLLSSEVVGQEASIEEALSELIAQTITRLSRPWMLPPPLPTRSNRRFAKAKRAVDSVVAAIVAERRSSGARHDDLLDMLLLERDHDTGEGMTDVQLKDEVMTIFVAGHETTANALTWTFWLIMKHPAVEQRLRDELKTILAGKPPGADDLARLPYLGAVIKEALRLYPPVWLVVRVALQEVQLGDLLLPKGGYLFFSPWLVHRRKASWREPEAFLPERWLDGDKPEKGAYLPFITGPRKCIGDGYALMEATLAVATILQSLRLTPVSDAPLLAQPLITLRPQGGLWVRADGN